MAEKKDTILTTTSSFASGNPELLACFATRDLQLVQNPYARKLTEQELAGLLTKFQPIGMIAGVEPITREILYGAAKNLLVISRVGVGWNNVDHKAAQELGIKVFRTPDAVTRPVVELTIGLFLDLARHLSLQDRWLRSGIWRKNMGSLIRGKMLTVIGCGRIGKEVALIMRNLGCRVQALDPCYDIEWHEAHNIPLIKTLEEVFRSSDLISIHASMPENSNHLITKQHFDLARKNLLLINVARGGIIDEKALEDALRNGLIAGAALDVFENEPYKGPLCELDNIILTPHIGSYAHESRKQMEQEAVSNLLTGLGID